jgi:hypothetical protein
VRRTIELPSTPDKHTARPRSVAAALLGALALACQGGPGETTSEGSATTTATSTTTGTSTSSTGGSVGSSTSGEHGTTSTSTSTGTSTGSSSGGETDGACEIWPEGAIEAEYVGFCPDGEAIFISDADAWAAFVDECVFNGPDPAPDIDFAVTDIVGRSETISCPYEGGYQLLGAKRCDSTLEIHAWVHSDHCYCDYFVNALHLWAVPKGTIDEVVWVEVPEVTCEEVTCTCPEETPGCEAGACGTVPDPDVDGLPPAWP